jgi:peptidoglycan/LPS O-acetylase OafA/YrhL
MKLNILFSIYAVVAAISCVLYLGFPAFSMSLYSDGVSADPQAIMLFRLVGALFGGIAVMVWLSRNAEPSESRDALVRGLAVLNGLAAIVTFWATVSGVYNQFSWGPFVTCVLFAIGFHVLGPGLSASLPKRG